MKKSFKYIILAGLALFSSCEEFLDINTDPNNPSEAPISLLLPNIQVETGEYMGMATHGLSNITSTYMHQLVQRGVEENDYGFRGSTFGVSAPWTQLYLSPLTDIEGLIDQASALEATAYVGIAQVMKAYIYSILVDLWGDVPYSEANLGSENTAPSYDDGEVIYGQLLTLLDEAIVNLKAESTILPGDDDIIYGGDLSNWIKLANTLKLKMYNQTRLVNDVSAEVNNLINNEPLFTDLEDDFELPYGTSAAPENRNPAYVQEWAPGGAYYYISPYFYEIMKGEETFFSGNPLANIWDPRVPYYFYNQIDPSDEEPENPPSYFDATTGFLGIYTFSFNIDPNEGYDQSSSQTIAGLYPVGGKFDDGSGVDADFNGVGDVPQRMLTYFSSLYTRAELAWAGVSSENARNLFEAAMRASFAKVNEVAENAGAPEIPQSEIDDYVDDVLALYDAADNQGKLQLIMTEKWIASFGFGVDAYTDYRRTGYPILHDGNTDNLNVTVRGREFPVAFPYEIDDLELNPNAPAQRNVTSDRVFWDN